MIQEGSAEGRSSRLRSPFAGSGERSRVLDTHPTVCLLCLLALAVVVHALSLTDLALTYALLLLGSALRGGLAEVARSGWRLRYLLLALLVSFGFLEGDPLAGARHALLLLVVAGAVQIQFLLHSPEACGSALTQLLAPLGKLREPVGRRLALTLAMVPALLDGLAPEQRRSTDWVGMLAAQVHRVENPTTVLPAKLPGLPAPEPLHYLPLLATAALLTALVM